MAGHWGLLLVFAEWRRDVLGLMSGDFHHVLSTIMMDVLHGETFWGRIPVFNWVMGQSVPSTMPNPDRRIGTSARLAGSMPWVSYSAPSGVRS